MSNDPVGRRPSSADLHSKLRLAALAAVIVGVVLLAAAAFVLSYEGIHQIALRAGVSPGLAKLHPLIFDAMLVIAAAAALSLRGAGWWARCYAWGSLLILLAAVAVGNALYATGITLPAQPTKAALAVTPWVLLLMAFGLLLEMLRHFRATPSAAGKAPAAAAASGSAGAAAGVNGGPRPAVTQAAAPGGKVRELPRVDLDTLLGPRVGEPPPIEVLRDTGAGENTDHQADPVSYGEETGYVHPDSYLNEGEYSPHGDAGGPADHAGQAGDGTHLTSHGATSAETPAAAAEAPATSVKPPATAAEAPATAAEAPAAAAESPATAAESPATAAEAPATATESPATAAEAPATSAEAPATSAEPPATSAEAPATSAEPPATAAEAPATSAEPPATSAEAPATSAEPPATSAEAPATAAEGPATSAEPPATAAEAPATSAETPATSAETPATSAETPATSVEPPATSAETAATIAVAMATPAETPAGEAAPGTENGVASGGGQAAAETPAGQDSTAEAGQGGDGVTQAAAGAEAPALERIRSTPTRPE